MLLAANGLYAELYRTQFERQASVETDATPGLPVADGTPDTDLSAGTGDDIESLVSASAAARAEVAALSVE